MFVVSGSKRPTSRLVGYAIFALILLVAISLVTQIVIYQADLRNTQAATFSIIILRQVDSFLEILITPATLLFIAIRFFETKTFLSVGFDTTDLEKMSVKGPDEENVIWIGRRYESVIEADAVMAVLERRLERADANDAEQARAPIA